jgi:hypothetical protein
MAPARRDAAAVEPFASGVYINTLGPRARQEFSGPMGPAGWRG